MPQQLMGHMNPDTWRYLVNMYNGSAGTGTCQACLVECAVCWLCAFPFVFLCHPCIADRFTYAQRRNEIHQLNQSLFGGAPVISIPDNGGLIFNTDCLINAAQPIIYQPGYMPPMQPGYAQPQYGAQPGYAEPQYGAPMNAQPPMAVAYSINEPTHYPGGNASKVPPPPYSVETNPSIIQAPPRLMQVTVPEGTYAGDSITVVSPENQRIVAIVPQGMAPGMSFQIAY